MIAGVKVADGIDVGSVVLRVGVSVIAGVKVADGVDVKASVGIIVTI